MHNPPRRQRLPPSRARAWAEILRGPERKRKRLPEHARKMPPRSFAGWLATGLGVGFAPIAPGTFGSALGVVLFAWLLSQPLGAYVAVVLAVIGLGVWAADVTGRVTGQTDDGRIVIDEVAGQLVTLGPVLALSGNRTVWLVTGFVVFRLLDIWKPGPVGWAERSFSGGLGVMADDLVAGVLGAGLLAVGIRVTA